MQKATNSKYLIPLILVACSIVFFILAGLQIATRYAKPEPVLAESIKQSSPYQVVVPINLKISEIGIDTVIVSSTKLWEENAKSAVHLAKTPLPGSKGNSVIYGHNFPNILGKLSKASTGDIIEIAFSDGSIKKFSIIQKINVTADQTHILEQTGNNRLTIFTCSGIFDSKRLVVIAKSLD